MLILDHKNLKNPAELRRLAAIADVETKDLIDMTGLSESAINNYFSDECTRQNYLFQFALEFLVQEKLHQVSSEIYFTPSPFTFKRMEQENKLMFNMLERFEQNPCQQHARDALVTLLAVLRKRPHHRSQTNESHSDN